MFFITKVFILAYSFTVGDIVLYALVNHCIICFWFQYRFYCTLIAAKRILNKMTSICSSGPENIEVLHFSLKLVLYALNAYASGVGDDAKQIIKEHILDVQAYLVNWLNRPEVEFGSHFGGKNGNKMKVEVKVCGYTIRISM